MAAKKLAGAAAFAAALAGGGVAGAVLGMPSVGMAQTAEPTETTTAPTDTTTQEAPSTTAGEGATEESADGDCEWPGGRRGFARVDLAVAAEALGITEDELHTALEDGKSVADVAGERGVDVQTVIDALVADATASIDQAVADGDLTEERAAALKDGLAERITDLVNRDLPGPIGPWGHGGHFFAKVDLGVAAEALGITEDELRTAFEDGKSIADVAGERGVDVQTVIDALVADATAAIDQAVTDGDLTADEATELKDGLAERITEAVNGDFPVPFGRGGPRGPWRDGIPSDFPDFPGRPDGIMN